jgi:trehalose 6-phosphate synthase
LGNYALTVSPFDTYSTANAMHHALTMPGDERRQRAEALRKTVQGAGVRTWFYDQMEDALTALNSQVKNASTS